MLHRKERYEIMLIIFMIILVSGYLIFNIIDILRYRSGRPDQIAYTNKLDGSADYQVYLKANPFIESEYMTSNLSYITDLIEYIKPTFLYSYKGNKNVTVDYDYWIKGEVISEYATDSTIKVSKPIWNKTFVLLDHKKGTSTNSTIKINESLNIGIDYYNHLINNFINTLNIPTDSRLEVTFFITVNGKLPYNNNFIKEHYLTLKIPLGVKVFDISLYKNFSNMEVIYSKGQVSIEKSYVLSIIYIILVITIISGGSYLAKKILNKQKDPYRVKLDKILKDYDERIITVSNFIKYDKLDVVDVSSFEELLNLSDETLEPIIYWEKKNYPASEAWFAILRNRVLYLYIISREMINKVSIKP